jgi:LTXXQ motif family protein
MKCLTLPVALLLATVSTTSWAQSAVEHEAHHPDQKGVPAAAQPQSPAGQPGMMGQGMMSGRGMMGDNMPMMQMMRMMGQSGAEAGCAGMSGMATIDRVEGRIAFLKTELKITDAQNAAWSAFADALRTNAKSLGEVRASMMPQEGAGQQSLVDRLALHEKWLAARLEGTRAMKSALTNLVGTLSDEQKKTSDELLAPHLGMNAMAGMAQCGQMGQGRMQPGMMTQGQGR